jgi:subtilase family serine protease
MGTRPALVPGREPVDRTRVPSAPPLNDEMSITGRYHMNRRRKTFRPLVDRLDDRCLLSALSPSQIEAAYGLSTSSTAGSGKTIAVIDAFNDPYIASELAAFDSTYGLPGTSANVANYLGVVNLAGNRIDPGWAQETALDVEWAHAIAPGARILLVEARSDSLTDLMTAAETAVADGANVVSMSWGESDSYLSASQVSQYDAFFQQHESTVTFVASSGDSGTSTANGGGAEWPSSSPYVLSVGGTTLAVNANGTYAGESAWSSSGGGLSALEPEPNYQLALQRTGRRSTPDVAFDGNPNTGVMVYSAFVRGGWEQVGGTSLGSPAWAAIVATIDSQARTSLGSAQMLNALYSLNTAATFDLHGISASTASGGVNTFATATYNTSTGLGTPTAKLLSDLTFLGSVSGGTNPVISTAPLTSASLRKAATTTSSSQTTGGTRSSATTPVGGQYPTGWWPGGSDFTALGGSEGVYVGPKYSVIGSSGTRRA